MQEFTEEIYREMKWYPLFHYYLYYSFYFHILFLMGLESQNKIKSVRVAKETATNSTFHP